MRFMMGHVQAFDLTQLINTFSLKGYIETGTGIGDSLSHALKFDAFEELHTIEIDKDLYDKAIIKFQDPRLKIYNKYSREALPEILGLIKEDKNYLFFMDAHFPEADFGIAPDRYQTSLQKYGKDALPLEEELSIIRQKRLQAKDVLIIDDVWIYEKGPFETGNWIEQDKMSIGNMNFVSNLFKETHEISKFYKQQGYLLLLPIRETSNG